MTRLAPLLLALSFLLLAAAHAAPVPLTLPATTPAPPVTFESHIRAAESAVRAHLPQIAATEYQAALRLSSGLPQARQGLAALPAAPSRKTRQSEAGAHRRENGPDAGFTLKP